MEVQEIPEEATASQKALKALAVAMFGGLAGVLAFATHGEGVTSFFVTSGVGVLLGGAALLLGGTLGFLFGIPRTLQRSVQDSEEEKLAGDQAALPSHRVDYRANTNLEQISDWLTKILVGVGLTQISEIRQFVQSLTRFASRGLGAGEQGHVFSFVLVCYCSVLGFLFGYLWTRLYLAGALRLADQATIGALTREVRRATEQAQSTERKLDELKEQARLDASALNLAYHQLTPTGDRAEVSQSELDAAIKASSVPVKIQIFNQAAAQRSQNWRDPDTKPRMERTIPIFRSLIADDNEQRFHRNHAQLAYTLKDKRDPEWEEALRELNSAIAIRGPAEVGWNLYEFNRALCRIALDPNFARNVPTDGERARSIHEDVAAARAGVFSRHAVEADPMLKRWIAVNKVG